MNDYLADSVPVARPYCPGCEPKADPLAETLDLRWCQTHVPGAAGLDDAAVKTEAFLSGKTEAGGADNRRWCKLIHDRGAERARRRTPQ